MAQQRTGLSDEQKEALRAKDREWYASHADAQRARHTAYYARNRSKVLAQKAERRKRDSETVRALDREYYWRNPELHRRESRESARKNPETRRAWKAKNIERVREYCRRRQARIRGTAVEPVDYAQVWKESSGICGICQGAIKVYDQIHFDHVVPLAKGGTHTRDNIQVAHAHCNLSKLDKVAAA